jgi:hypothetical protein
MILAFQYNRLQDSELVAMRKAINELAKKLPEGESPVGFMILRKGVLGAAVAKCTSDCSLSLTSTAATTAG